MRVYSRSDLLFSPLSIRAECGNWEGDALSMHSNGGGGCFFLWKALDSDHGRQCSIVVQGT